MATPGARYATLKQDTEFTEWDIYTGDEIDRFLIPAGTIVDLFLWDISWDKTDPYYVATVMITEKTMTRACIPKKQASDYLDFLE